MATKSLAQHEESLQKPARNTGGAQEDARERVVPGILETLQQSMGNQAVGKILQRRDHDAKARAESESVVAISPQAQLEIEAQASGVAFDGALRDELETSLGSDFTGVRLHKDPEAGRLARSLGANAFTQGRDVFLGDHVDPDTEEGRSTVAHEMTHVSQGLARPGTVQREAAGPVGATAGIGAAMGAATSAAAESATPAAKPAAENKGSAGYQALWDISVVSPIKEAGTLLKQKDPDYNTSFAKLQQASQGVQAVGKTYTETNPAMATTLKLSQEQIAKVMTGLAPYMGTQMSMATLTAWTDEALAGASGITAQLGEPLVIETHGGGV